MKRNSNHTAFTAGTALLAALALSPVASAATTPFASAALPGGYMLADNMDKPMKSTEEAKCGAQKAKEQEMKQKGSMDSSDAMAKPAKEMKEAKCGADKKKK